MNKYRISLFVLGIIGLLISTYLLGVYVLGGPIKCYGGHGCDIVRASEYASFLGIPTPAYGAVFYVVLLSATLLIKEKPTKRLKQFLQLHTTIGLVVSGYLTYLEAFVIHAWCLWCVASATVATLAFLVVCLYTEQKSR